MPERYIWLINNGGKGIKSAIWWSGSNRITEM